MNSNLRLVDGLWVLSTIVNRRQAKWTKAIKMVNSSLSKINYDSLKSKTVLDESHHVRSLRIKVGPNSKKEPKTVLDVWDESHYKPKPKPKSKPKHKHKPKHKPKPKPKQAQAQAQA